MVYTNGKYGVSFRIQYMVERQGVSEDEEEFLNGW